MSIHRALFDYFRMKRRFYVARRLARLGHKRSLTTRDIIFLLLTLLWVASRVWKF